MSAKSGSFLGVCLSAFVVGGAIYTFTFVPLWLDCKIHNQDNLIKKHFHGSKKKMNRSKNYLHGFQRLKMNWPKTMMMN